MITLEYVSHIILTSLYSAICVAMWFRNFLFQKGITLPIPPVIEGLEQKMPIRCLEIPAMIDFLKVSRAMLSHHLRFAFERYLIFLFS